MPELATRDAIGHAGRLLATGGASTIEGSAGGGIVPWAVIAGYGTEDQWGGAAFATRVEVRDYALTSQGVTLGWRNRVELGLARQQFGLPTLAEALSLPTREFRQDIVQAKVRLAGDLVYTPMPQLSLGIQHKTQRDFLVPSLVGARDDSDLDVYLAASKLFLAPPAAATCCSTARCATRAPTRPDCSASAAIAMAVPRWWARPVPPSC